VVLAGSGTAGRATSDVGIPFYPKESPMSIFRPRQGQRNRFAPRVEHLEDRLTPVRCVPIGASVFCFPEGPPTPPRTGGAAFLSGSVLIVITNHPGANQGVIQDDGAGNVTVEWNGHTPPTFHGVTRIVLDGKGRSNTFDFSLTGNVTKPQEVDLLLHGTHSSFSENLGGFDAGGLTFDSSTAPAPANLAKGP
jgi:hypothetical protein